MFCRPANWRTGFPKLKGRAAEIKHFIPALSYAWGKIMTSGNNLHEMISIALRANHEMDKILDDHPTHFVLPTDVADNFVTHAMLFLNQYTTLAEEYNKDGAMVFNLTVKAHLVCHIALRCHSLNPRRSWCFSGERMMLLVRKLGQSCVSGTRPWNVGDKILVKYRHALNFVLQEAGRWTSELELEEWHREAELLEADFG